MSYEFEKSAKSIIRFQFSILALLQVTGNKMIFEN